MKKIISLIVVVTLVFIFSSCGKKEENKYSTTSPNQLNSESVSETTNVDSSFSTEIAVVLPPTTVKTKVEPSESTTLTTVKIEHETKVEPTPPKKPILPETTKNTIEKTGDMVFTYNPNNRYIKAIVKKYNVSAKNLACLYTVPLNDSNIVMEFNGTTDENGKLLRNKDTLIAIYTIDKNLNSKRASNDKSLNEYSYGEMKVIFLSTTKYIMPEFQEELSE